MAIDDRLELDIILQLNDLTRRGRLEWELPGFLERRLPTSTALKQWGAARATYKETDLILKRPRNTLAETAASVQAQLNSLYDGEHPGIYALILAPQDEDELRIDQVVYQSALRDLADTITLKARQTHTTKQRERSAKLQAFKKLLAEEV
ncbi:MAG: hypothetical protein AAF730_13955 [Bacteroidota bacterium]